MRISLYLLHSFAPSQFNSKGTAYDLGANHGEFGSYLAGKFQSVVCVEPNPQLNLSGLPSNVSVLRCAVGWPAARSWFKVSGVDVYSSLAGETNQPPGGSKDMVQVDVRTLADLFERHPDGPVDFVKMDIEGAELDVLLSENADVLTRIKQLTVEFHDFIDPSTTPRVLAAIARMKTLGFAFFRFSVTNNGDVLFLNTRHVRIGPLGRLWIMFRYCWLRGLVRRIFRKLRPRTEIPGGGKFLE